ncbi:hypothetical protein LXA43DRAFT_1102241 [Ganoderma leucocontextum]|nr:hypothetical protein LXA43DRAFT_1102241 [Ganoderma leucocontextum]
MADNLSEVDIEKMFEEYIPGGDPSASLLDHCHYDAGVADATKESDLNPILCKIANSVIALARLSPTVVVRDISCWQVSGGDGKTSKRGTRADCAVYLDNDRTRTIVDINPDDFMKTSEMSLNDKNHRKDRVGRRAWGDIVALLEAKHNHDHCAFEFKNPGSRFIRDHTALGRRALGQFAEYIAHILAHQHRTHVLALYVFRDEARLCYFDRSGGVVSKPFHYGTSDDTTLQRFFYRLAGMTHQQLGFDPTATLASQEVVDDLRNWVATIPTEYLREQAYQALCWDPKTRRSSSVEWPTHEIAFKDKTLYIGKPAFSNLSLFGRSTRGYVAIEKETEEDGSTAYALRYLKDAWRLMHPNIHPEHEVYERLASRGVSRYVPTCLGGEDVPDECGVWQQTKTWVPLRSKPLPRGHYRVLLKEVCRPLSHFDDFSDLALVLGNALSAHRDAWVKAEILHRDISYNNILIYDTKNENGEDVRVGLLADWDLSKYKEYMVTGFGPRQPDRTGTWYFRSAVSQRYPTKPYAVSDDIEAFVHVFHYCVLRFHETEHSRTLADFVRMTYEHEEKRAEDGAHVGGSVKFAHMCNPFPVIVPYRNPTLLTALQELARLCAAHYATIDTNEYDRRYNPPVSQQVVVAPVTADKPPRRSRVRARDWEDGDDVQSKVPAPRPALQSVGVPPRPALEDHTELYRFFRQWGTFEWDAHDLTKSGEDLFKKVGLAASEDNAFGSSQSASGSSQSSGGARAAKKVKRNDGTPLASVEESTER